MKEREGNNKNITAAFVKLATLSANTHDTHFDSFVAGCNKKEHIRRICRILTVYLSDVTDTDTNTEYIYFVKELIHCLYHLSS